MEEAAVRDPEADPEAAVLAAFARIREARRRAMREEAARAAGEAAPAGGAAAGAGVGDRGRRRDRRPRGEGGDVSEHGGRARTERWRERGARDLSGGGGISAPFVRWGDAYAWAEGRVVSVWAGKFGEVATLELTAVSANLAAVGGARPGLCSGT